MWILRWKAEGAILEESYMSSWIDKRIVVTGGNGFLGSRLVDKLRERGAHHVVVPLSRDYDLVKYDDAVRLCRDAQPDLVIRLSARVGGIGANRSNPGKFFYDNLMMGVQLMDIARMSGIQEIVAIGTVLAYTKFGAVPFTEENLSRGCTVER